MERIRILVADDHAQVRTQVQARLAREAAFEIVAAAENSGQAVELALATKPDIVLLDPMMMDGLGMEACRQIAARLPATAIVVLVAFCDTAHAIEFRKMGVRGIVNKGIESYRLVDLLKQVAPPSAQSRS